MNSSACTRVELSVLTARYSREIRLQGTEPSEGSVALFLVRSNSVTIHIFITVRTRTSPFSTPSSVAGCGERMNALRYMGEQ